MFLCLSVFVSVCVYVRLCGCVYLCAYVCMCVCVTYSFLVYILGAAKLPFLGLTPVHFFFFVVFVSYM